MRKYLLLFFLLIPLLFANETNTTKTLVDPVYGLPVDKYPKFQAKIDLADGKEILFCCPKAMFDLYFRPFAYPEYKIKEEKDFKKLYVKDVLSGEWIDAKKALYVFGSRLKSPKGDDLIPVKNKESLAIFKLKYGGSRVLTFGEIVQKGFALIKYLDMP